MEVIEDLKIADPTQINVLKKEAETLLAIFVATLKTLRSKLEQEGRKK